MNSTPSVILIRNAASYDFGGGERFPIFLAVELAKNGFEPTIISRHQTLRELARDCGVATIRGWWWSRQNWSGWRNLLLPLYVCWQLVLFFYYLVQFVRLKPAAVHIQSKDDFIAASYAARVVGATVVWTDHADLKHIFKNVRTWYKNPIGKLVYLAARAADAITVVSKSEKSAVCTHLGAGSKLNDKITVIYNGCADVLSHYPSHATSPSTTFVIASRLVTDKGISEAIEAFIDLHNEYSDTTLCIAGDGPEKEKFTRQASLHKSITFIGHQKDPYAVMKRGDVFVQPTYHEGFSVVLVEACMLEMPIITTSVGGNVEIITHEKNGLLVPAKDSVVLSKAMRKLHTDKKLRDTLAKEARCTYLKSFVFDEIVKERFIPLYEATD